LTNLHVAILASPRSKPNAAKTYPFSPAIERILEQNPRTIAIKDKKGNSPLHAAAGNPAIVETLLRYVSGAFFKQELRDFVLYVSGVPVYFQEQ